MSTQSAVARPLGFFEELHEQRWDDHRLYHRHFFNQSMHLLSALCFLGVYVTFPFHPVEAALFGWLVAMWPRQLGHFFFEPRSFDEVNKATFEEKESAKVGFNLQRKTLLFVSWLALSALPLASPTLFGFCPAWHDRAGLLHHVGVLWIVLAFGGLLARTLYLCATRSAQTGLVWFTKILTDPFHDLKMYYRAPLRLLRGERLDPMTHVR